ncbi:Uncharacterised protein [Arachnia propionica]|nr:Uncharacterised protein [Arachnia propionica]
MESDLEGWNNHDNSAGGVDDGIHVSMKSGLEDRNNNTYADKTIYNFTESQ